MGRIFSWDRKFFCCVREYLPLSPSYKCVWRIPSTCDKRLLFTITKSDPLSHPVIIYTDTRPTCWEMWVNDHSQGLHHHQGSNLYPKTWLYLLSFTLNYSKTLIQHKSKNVYLISNFMLWGLFSFRSGRNGDWMFLCNNRVLRYIGIHYNRFYCTCY